MYGKISEIFKETLKKAIDDEDFNLYNIINQQVINKQLVQQSVDGSLIQFHNDLNNIEDILPPEFKITKAEQQTKDLIHPLKVINVIQLYQTKLI